MNFFTVPIRIIGVALLCAIGLIALVVREGAARVSGTEIVMRMEAVDPRALLTGHYVIVSLQEPLDNAPCPPGLRENDSYPGEDAWVALAPRGDHHSVAGVAETREGASAHAPLVVRGSASCTPSRPKAEGDEGFAGALRAELGTERFHINQRQAERIEEIMRDREVGEPSPVSAILSVGADGRARLVGLIVEGERVELALY